MINRMAMKAPAPRGTNRQQNPLSLSNRRLTHKTAPALGSRGRCWDSASGQGGSEAPASTFGGEGGSLGAEPNRGTPWWRDKVATLGDPITAEHLQRPRPSHTPNKPQAGAVFWGIHLRLFPDCVMQRG